MTTAAILIGEVLLREDRGTFLALLVLCCIVLLLILTTGTGTGTDACDACESVFTLLSLILAIEDTAASFAAEIIEESITSGIGVGEAFVLLLLRGDDCVPTADSDLDTDVDADVNEASFDN